MATVAQHYSDVLAPVYVWMVGGLDAALAQGESDIASLSLSKSAGQSAVDLGAGFGMHSIPLARRGYSVLSIDTSAHLLATLRDASDDGLRIHAVESDLLKFPEYLSEPANLILCMGDTLTHLDSREAVLELWSKVRSSIASGGTFSMTFRNYASLPKGVNRMIPVRSDSDRILTCFLEEAPEHVVVHDILYEREGPAWVMKVSDYKKLRLDPGWVVSSLEALSFRVQQSIGPRGMVHVVATI